MLPFSAVFFAVFFASLGGQYMADNLLPRVIARVTTADDYRFFTFARKGLKAASMLGAAWLVVVGAALLAGAPL